MQPGYERGCEEGEAYVIHCEALLLPDALRVLLLCTCMRLDDLRSEGLVALDGYLWARKQRT